VQHEGAEPRWSQGRGRLCGRSRSAARSVLPVGPSRALSDMPSRPVTCPAKRRRGSDFIRSWLGRAVSRIQERVGGEMPPSRANSAFLRAGDSCGRFRLRAVLPKRGPWSGIRPLFHSVPSALSWRSCTHGMPISPHGVVRIGSGRRFHRANRRRLAPAARPMNFDGRQPIEIALSFSQSLNSVFGAAIRRREGVVLGFVHAAIDKAAVFAAGAGACRSGSAPGHIHCRPSRK